MKNYLLLLFLFGITFNLNAQSFNKPKGYMGLVEIGGGIGTGDWAADRFSISMINGYRLMPQFAVGVGVGFQMSFHDSHYGQTDYDSGKTKDFSLPIFLHLRSDFINGKVSPFVAFNIGYNIHLGESGDSFGAPSSYPNGNSFEEASMEGIILEPTAGVSFNVGQNRMTVGVSFMLNRMKYTLNGSSEKEMANSFNLKVGYSF